MTVSDYFTKVKSLCEEISKLDPENHISETRIKRIIVHGLRPEFNGLVTTICGWAKEPTLEELENTLANQEALDKQLSKVTMKDEEVLFSKKVGNGQRKATRPREGKKQEWRRRPGRSRQQGGLINTEHMAMKTYKNTATTNATTVERKVTLHVTVGIRRNSKEML
ncbi:hypothetical protein LINPERHAP2_LOCUS41897 [Linum perenne]